MIVNGLQIPAAIIEAVERGIWKTPQSRAAWLSLFPDEEIVQPMLYPLADMVGRTSWEGVSSPPYLGRTDEGVEPGDIDPRHAVIIGDLGPDRLIALDYRQHETAPTVVALTSDHQRSWRRVAENAESFLKALKLND